MSNRKKQPRNKVSQFLKHLRGMLDSLPSESEKQEIKAALSQINGFLNELTAQVELVPSAEQASGVRAAVERLEQAAQTGSLLASALGLPRPRARRPGTNAVAEATLAEGRNALEALQALPIDEIRSKLQSDSYPLSTLRAVAYVLGLKPKRGLNREALAHQVAMRIANTRGYERLRGATSDAPSHE